MLLAPIDPLNSPAATDREESDFASELRRLRSRHAKLWQQCGDEPASFGRRYDVNEQRQREARINCWSRSLERRLLSSPSQGLREELRTGIKDCLFLPEDEADLISSDELFGATLAFVRQARKLDPEMRLEDTAQALRNLWIMNLFQLFQQRPPELTPAVFAYSMLYPLTDNALDDPDESSADKQRRCSRLGQRLRGIPVSPADPLERNVFRMVELIEEQYPREQYPHVYRAVLAIHQAQLQSLAQQSCSTLPDDIILDYSVAKGGASVLADAYLVAGHPLPEDEDFYFGYGVFLQLADDLQDTCQDLEVGHQTLFSRSVLDRLPLDGLVYRLHDYLDTVLRRSRRFCRSHEGRLRRLVKGNCQQLLVQSIGAQPQHFSSELVKHAESYSPVRFGFARERRSRLADWAQRQHGPRSGALFELLDTVAVGHVGL